MTGALIKVRRLGAEKVTERFNIIEIEKISFILNS